MSRSLENKVVVITGGASGIGRAIGEEMATRGAEVVLADRQADLADEVARGIASRGGRAFGTALDVRDLASFKAVVEQTVARSGRVDYMFNNAGIGVGGDMAAYSPADWDDVIDVNLRGVTNGIQAVYPLMIKQGSGHIVNTASMAGLVATPGEGGYVATKHAVVGLSKSLRLEAERYGVRVSGFCPGAIRTPILTGGKFGRINMKVPKEVLERMWERTRPMAPEVFAQKSVDAVLRNEAIIVFPRWWKAFWYVDRLSTGLSMQLWRVLFRRMRAEMEAAGVTLENPGAPD